MSGYSVHGFEDPNAKHTTSFEAKVPEARDPDTFPNLKEHSTASAPDTTRTSSLPQSGMKSAAGFSDNIPHDAAAGDLQQQPTYTAKGFKGRL